MIVATILTFRMHCQFNDDVSEKTTSHPVPDCGRRRIFASLLCTALAEQWMGNSWSKMLRQCGLLFRAYLATARYSAIEVIAFAGRKCCILCPVGKSFSPPPPSFGLGIHQE